MMDAAADHDLEAAADEERAAIVARYAAGRARTDHIDDWEDPGREDYHTTDRYSFIHDCRLPDTKSRTSRERKQIATERSREEKWKEMLFSNKQKYFGERGKLREKMIERVHKGVPNSMRSKLWFVLLDVETLKEEKEGVYVRMKEYALLRSPHIRQIDLDVNRTYRDNEMFRERYNSRQQALFHVLAAYSVYNTEVGYCQGMSQIAALLLMYLSEEEDAFWALSQLMANKKYAMHGFFIPGFPKLIRFQLHHDKVMKKFLPRLKKHMDKNGLDTSLYTLKWFFQCFLDRIPFSLALRVWDLYILEGECILTAMSYNILKMHRRKLRTYDMDRLCEHLQQNLSKNFEYEDDAVIERLRDVMYELRSNRLASPGAQPDDEKPQKPFGMIPDIRTLSPRPKPSLQELGIRTGFSEREREVSQQAIRRQMELESELLRQQEEEEAAAGELDEEDGGGRRNGSVSFDPAGTSSPRSSSRRHQQQQPPRVKSPTDELDESVRMLLAGAADLNGTEDSVINTSANNAVAATRAADTSFDSVVSRESNRSDVVRIRVPYNKEDAVNAKKNQASSGSGGGDRNRIRISVTATPPPPPTSSDHKRRSAGHNNSVSSNTESSLSSSAGGGSTKRHSYTSQTYTSQSLGRKTSQQSSSKTSDKLSTSLEGASVSVSRYEKIERYEHQSSTSSSTKRTLAANNTTALTHHQ